MGAVIHGAMSAFQSINPALQYADILRISSFLSGIFRSAFKPKNGGIPVRVSAVKDGLFSQSCEFTDNWRLTVTSVPGPTVFKWKDPLWARPKSGTD